MNGVTSMTNDILQKALNDKADAINKLFVAKEAASQLKLELDEARAELVSSELEYYDLRCAVDRLAKELNRLKDSVGQENYDALMGFISAVPDRTLSIDVPDTGKHEGDTP